MQPSWPMGLSRQDVDHVLVVVSDVEIGCGGPTDDFPQSDALAELLRSYLDTPPFSELELSFVFNGDTFDFLKVPIGDGTYPIHIDEDAALEKLRRIERAHGPFFDALAELATRANVHFVVGNHDAELVFPAVQRRLSRLGPNVHHEGFTMQVGTVRLEHGHQRDPMFRMDESTPFIEIDGKSVLNLPWGSLALLEVAVPLHPVFYPFDRVRPRMAPLEHVPEVRELLLSKYWDYWTREFWQQRETDPLHRVSWTMLRQVAYRFSSRDPDVPEFDPSMLRDLEGDGVSLMGHRHTPVLWDRDTSRFLQTGCFRNEFRYDPEDTRELLPSVYAEVYLGCGKVRRSRLVEVDMPPPEEVPGDLSRFGPVARAMLPAGPGSAQEQDAQEARERRALFRGLAPKDFVRTLADTLRRRIVS